MASLEERMLQKDKETAVLKANYKHQILLNIRLDRIEKCKKTYESYHSFEVAVMKRRRGRILRTQSELKRMKVYALDSKCDRGSLIGKVQGQKMEKSEVSVYTQLNYHRAKVVQVPTGYTPSPEKHTDMNIPTTHTKEPSFVFNRSHVNGGTVTHDALLMARDATNLTHGEIRPESRKHSVKFPGLTPSPGPKAAQYQDPRRPDAACSNSQTHAVNSNSGKVRTSTSHSRNFTNGKSRHSASTAVDLSPFEQFRLKLQESEARSWKNKVPLRSISAVDAIRKRSGISEISTIQRRSRSAVIQ